MPAVMGQHKLGDLHFYTRLPKAVHWLGLMKDERFDTEEAFASLVTAVHESYHVVQEMLLGLPLWRWTIREELAYQAIKVFKSTPDRQKRRLWKPSPSTTGVYELDWTDGQSVIEMYRIQQRELEKVISSPNWSARIIEKELHGTPELTGPIGHDLRALTSVDLFECQAALLTELFVSKLVRYRPETFSRDVIEKLGPLFRIEQMSSTYSRPLRIIDNVLGMPPTWRSEQEDPIYGQVRLPAIYDVAVLLLDIALHVPPHPIVTVSRWPDLSAWEDILPVTRFLKMLWCYRLEVTTNAHGHRPVLLDMDRLYTEGSRFLTSMANDANARARAQDKRMRYDDPNNQSTFHSPNKVTKLWLEWLEHAPAKEYFPRLFGVRKQALVHRRKTPRFWFDPPASTLAVLGVPRIYSSPGDMESTGFIYTVRPTEEHIPEAWALSWLTDDGKVVESPGLPIDFLDKVNERDMICRIGEALVNGSQMRCPMTEAPFATIPESCKARTVSCKKIRDLRGLPKRECHLRRVGETIFGKDRLLYGWR